MARVALQCLALIDILLAVALVSISPEPTRTRLQCPSESCSKAFGSETGFRQHRSALGRKGGPADAGYMFDVRLPIESGWSGHGQRAAGMVQNMNCAAARLEGLDLVDSDGIKFAGRGRPGGQTRTRMCPGRPLTHRPLPAGPPPRLLCLRCIE